MSKRNVSKRATTKSHSKLLYKNDLRISNTRNINSYLKPDVKSVVSQNVIGSNLKPTVYRISKSTCHQDGFTGNPVNAIKWVEHSRGSNCEFWRNNSDQHLLMSCATGHKFVVQHLLLQGACTETTDTHGYTPLLVAAERGFTEIVRLLLDRGADVNATNIRGDSALTLSVRSCGSKDMVSLLLLQKSVDVNHRNKDGYTCWMKAVEALDFDTLKLLIKSGKVINKDINSCKELTNKKVSTISESESDFFKECELVIILSLLEREAKGPESSLRIAVFQRDLKSATYLIDYGIYTPGLEADRDLLMDFLEDIEKKHYNILHVIKTELEIIRKLLETGAGMFLQNDNGANILVMAVNMGSYELVELLCQHDISPNTQSSKPPHQNAVMAAAEKGRCDLLKVLMRYNADIQCTNRAQYPLYLNSPLEIALKSGEVNVVELLIRNGVSFNVETGLHIAVENKRLHSLRFMVGKFSNICQAAIHNNSNGLIHKAVELGDVDIINTLLELGSDVNCFFEGKTPLMNAGTPEVLELLIRRGAEVSNQSEQGNKITLLSYIIMRESKEEIYRTLTRGLGITAEQSSSHINLKDMVEILLRNGASVNDTDSSGQTPLMAAAQQSDGGNVLTVLLEAGAEVNKADCNGVTALHEAVNSVYLKNVEILIESGADVNKTNKDGRTVLHEAIHNEEILKCLLQHGADIDAEDDNGNTALFMSVINYSSYKKISLNVLDFLLEAGSNVNHQNATGETALMKAAFGVKEALIKILCEANADVKIRTLDKTHDAISILVDRLCHSHKNHGEVRDLIFYLLDRGGSSSLVSLENVYFFILNGCLTIVQRLVKAGLGPSDIVTEQLQFRHIKGLRGKKISPFCFALLCNQVTLARYFSDIWYLTYSDVSTLTQDKDVRRHLTRQRHTESLTFLEEFSSQPISLQKLSFVAVSTSIGTGPDRELRVRGLLLPNLFKDKLLFSFCCEPELQFDDDLREKYLWPCRLNYDLSFGDFRDFFYDSDASDYEHDLDYDYDYDYDNYFDYEDDYI